MRKERLPKHVSSFLDRHGKRRYRFRRKGQGGYFTTAPGTVQFREEYDAFMAGRSEPDAVKKIIPGSVDALLRLYYRSSDFAGQAQPVTLQKRRALIAAFVLFIAGPVTSAFVWWLGRRG